MGFLEGLARLFGIHKREASLLVIGLDNSGKSTLINHLKPSNSQSSLIVPTIGFQLEKFETKSINLVCFDMAGQGRYRNLWEHYYRDCDAIVFVIDSSDSMRLVVAQDEIEQMLLNPLLSDRNLPILFYANKMDVEDSLTSAEIANSLCLDKIRDKPWHICASNAITGEGVDSGMNWLIDKISKTLK